MVLCVSTRKFKNEVFSPSAYPAAINYQDELNKYMQKQEQEQQQNQQEQLTEKSKILSQNNLKKLKKLKKIKKQKFSRNKKKKIDEKDFNILLFSEYQNLLEFDYKVNQLKEMCKHYKLKKSGNKGQLINRIYNYLRLSHYTLKIQQIWRGYIYRKYIKGIGPGFKDRKKCNNQTDFYSLQPLHEIPYNQFFSYMDEDKFIYGFDILSLYNLIKKMKRKNARNPYNRNKIPKLIINNMLFHIELSYTLNIPLNLQIEKYENFCKEEQLEMEILELFQEIDNLGNYTNMQWFLNLNRNQLIRYCRELHDIWMYRAELSQDTRRDICPPTGNPFQQINFATITHIGFHELRELTLNMMKKLVRSGINRDNQCLGTYYLLSALTLVNDEAAIALPWLYESVVYNPNH